MARVQAKLQESRARVSVLAAAEQVALAEAVEDLRGESQFVDYAPGESRTVLPGVLTAAEKTETGQLRVYQLYPERFPSLYRTRDEKQKLADQVSRELLATLESVVASGEE